MPCTHKVASSGRTACFLCPPAPARMLPFPRMLPLPEPDEPVELEEQLHVLLEAQRAIDARLCRESLAWFVRKSWHVLESQVELEWTWHTQALCDHIQAMLVDQWRAQDDRQKTFKQRCQNLAINVPPGSLKSRILSVCAPAWAWLHRPRWSLLAMSVNPGVSDRDAAYFLRLVTDPWYRSTFQIQWEITKDAVKNIENSVGGTRWSRGMESKIVGIRADAIFIDDPNDIKEISDTKLDAVRDRWKAIQNRVNDDRTAVRMLIMQRCHERDLTGTILDSPEGADWQHLSIPMLSEKPGGACVACKVPHGPSFLGWTDPRKTEGESMHPARFTAEVIARMKRALGSYGFAGQAQQRPSPEGGGMFKKHYWRTFDDLEMTSPLKRSGDEPIPKLDQCVISVDANFKEGGTSNCCIGVVGGIGVKRFVLDCWADSVDYPTAKRRLEQFAKKYHYYTKIIIEDKANGSALIAEIGRAHRAVIAINPEGGKVSRANAILPDVEAGDVFLPRHAPWREAFIAEHASFPNGAKDDQVDMLSQAMSNMLESTDEERARAMGTW